VAIEFEGSRGLGANFQTGTPFVVKVRLLCIEGTTEWDHIFVLYDCEQFGISRMASSAMLGHVALVRTDVAEELSASIIKVTIIGELGTMLAVTCQLQLTLFLVHRFFSS
jgi:hypothetical protein